MKIPNNHQHEYETDMNFLSGAEFCKHCGLLKTTILATNPEETSIKQELKVTCLNIFCPERTSVCCGARPAAQSYKGDFVCCKCGKKYVGGECTAEKKVKDWFEDYDWRKKLTDLMKSYRDDEDIYFPEDLWSLQDEIERFTENLLIQILAKCESARDVREVRHILKDYLLKENN